MIIASILHTCLVLIIHHLHDGWKMNKDVNPEIVRHLHAGRAMTGMLIHRSVCYNTGQMSFSILRPGNNSGTIGNRTNGL